MLQKLFERFGEIRKELGTGHVFDVVGEVFPSNLLEKLFREMYAKRTDLPNIEARIVREVDADRFRKITNSTLEGLAKRELNLGAIVGKSAEARERRLIPEVIEDFFTAAGPISGVNARPVTKDGHVYVLPVFANRKIATINREMVQKFLAEKAKNYSRSSLRSMRVTIGLTLKWAAACGWIDKNPCTGVRLPVETGGRKVNRTVLSAEQINSIAENLEEPYATFILFLAVTGLRISEAIGIKWSDIQWHGDTHIIHIQRRIYCGDVDKVKSLRSARKLPLDEMLVAQIEALGKDHEWGSFVLALVLR